MENATLAKICNVAKTNVKITSFGTCGNISGLCVNKIVGCFTLSKAKNKFGFRVVKSSTPAI